MACLQTLCARFGNEDWVLLTEMPGSNWSFQIWGPEPALGKIGTTSEDEAKRLALIIVKDHLAKLGRSSECARLSTLAWRVAVRIFVEQTWARPSCHLT
jgi:hypothetical protein